MVLRAFQLHHFYIRPQCTCASHLLPVLCSKYDCQCTDFPPGQRAVSPSWFTHPNVVARSLGLLTVHSCNHNLRALIEQATQMRLSLDCNISATKTRSAAPASLCHHYGQQQCQMSAEMKQSIVYASLIHAKAPSYGVSCFVQ
jgi:hypothetical protein